MRYQQHLTPAWHVLCTQGINMIVLRTHVSYFINQLTMFDAPMTPRQLEYLRRTHLPIIAKHGLTQHHYDIMMQYLTDAMRSNDAEVCTYPCTTAVCMLCVHRLCMSCVQPRQARQLLVCWLSPPGQ
jgi:hypothetical protein